MLLLTCFLKTIKSKVITYFAVFSNFERIKCDEVESGSKNQDVPSSVDSRFFGLGGFIKQLFPGFNQGNQPRPGRNPGGIDFPGNSQFYPGRPIQVSNYFALFISCSRRRSFN